MLKNTYFLEKTVKKSPQRRGLRLRTPVGLWRLGAPPSNPRVVIHAYYYIFVEFISCSECLLLP